MTPNTHINTLMYAPVNPITTYYYNYYLTFLTQHKHFTGNMVISKPTCQAFLELRGGSQVDGAFIVTVQEVGICSVAQQQRTHLDGDKTQRIKE